MSWMFKWVFPIATVLALAAREIANAVGHPQPWLNDLAVLLAGLTGAKASQAAHTEENPLQGPQ
jgi:hypothetical protein